MKLYSSYLNYVFDLILFSVLLASFVLAVLKYQPFLDANINLRKHMQKMEFLSDST